MNKPHPRKGKNNRGLGRRVNRAEEQREPQIELTGKIPVKNRRQHQESIRVSSSLQGLRIPKKLPHSTQVSLTADDSKLWCLYVFFVMCNPQNNLQNLAGQLSDVLENLSPISQHDELEAKFREERAVLEAKYEKLYQPIYAKLTQEDTKMDEGEDKTAQERGVLSFWLTALQNNDVTSHEVTMHDEEALRTEIDWYPAKCVTQKILKKKPKKDEDIDEDRELQNLMEQDYEIGFTIRDKIILHAVHGLLVRLWKDMSLTWSSVVWLKKRIPNARFHCMAGNERSNADSRWNDIVGF
ncbi:BnaC03g72530D [Brassica napus]|uniref:BnaC03g72530D protein n=1 Tax=Brassica napus TaxID=3708 RepID=A0A078ISJ3_BRANA|nr:BnaC03g72530D [Brassica napus]